MSYDPHATEISIPSERGYDMKQAERKLPPADKIPSTVYSSGKKQIAVCSKCDTLAVLRYHAENNGLSLSAMVNGILDAYAGYFPIPKGTEQKAGDKSDRNPSV